MSDTLMTQEELRKRHVGTVGVFGQCAECYGAWQPLEPEAHRTGCPCDPQNVVVSREVLDRIAAIAHRILDDCDKRDWYAPDTAPQAEEILDTLRAALGEEKP